MAGPSTPGHSDQDPRWHASLMSGINKTVTTTGTTTTTTTNTTTATNDDDGLLCLIVVLIRHHSPGELTKILLWLQVSDLQQVKSPIKSIKSSRWPAAAAAVGSSPRTRGTHHPTHHPARKRVRRWCSTSLQ